MLIHFFHFLFIIYTSIDLHMTTQGWELWWLTFYAPLLSCPWFYHHTMDLAKIHDFIFHDPWFMFFSLSRRQLRSIILFIFLGSKITGDGDCSHEIERRLLLGRKSMTNLGSILKSRDITLAIKVRLVKAMVFPDVIYRCAS